ncbi:MAG TPA: hypothetical protein VMW75_20775, partial [Thermoanaerobaculia bacterium]|nr:hypothetical protein [Thermoanaerobaculia bacterium]
MRPRYLAIAIAALLLLAPPAAVRAPAESVIKEINITGFVPSPFPGLVEGSVVNQHWDSRCLPIHFKINNTQDPIPNPLGNAFLTVAEATDTLKKANDMWNAIPTAFIKADINGTVANPSFAGLDFINEITWRTGPGFNQVPFRGVFTRADEDPIAFVRRTVLLTDYFFNDGLDINGDGTPDVSAAITNCQENADGSTLFPAGQYTAGTWLDVDIIFNTAQDAAASPRQGFRFTNNPLDLGEPHTVDFLAVALHVMGMARGVGHTMINQLNTVTGGESVMFPYIDTLDPASQLARHSIDSDPAITVGGNYPKGSDTTGPAALGPGDVAFASTVGFITGEVHHGQTGLPLPGASVYAIDHQTGVMVSTAVSGTLRWACLPSGFGPEFPDPAYSIIDGKYKLVVPPGTYELGIQPVSGFPANHGNINLAALGAFRLGLEQGQDSWNEKLYTAPGANADQPQLVVVSAAGQTVSGIDFTTDKTVEVKNYGPFDALGDENAAPGTYYAVRVSASQLTQALAAATNPNPLLSGAFFMTGVKDSSVVPHYAVAMLTTGTVNHDGTAQVDVHHPLVKVNDFIGHNFNFTPLFFDDAKTLTKTVL